MQKRNTFSSPHILELRKKRRRKLIIKTVLWSFVFFLIIFGLAYLSRLPALNITDIEITGNKVIDVDTIKESINTQISGKYLWLFPKSNLLIYPQNAIQKSLETQFGRIENISLSVSDDRVLTISLYEREAGYLWCGVDRPADISENVDNQKCYFLDQNGYIFDEAPFFSEGVYFKFYGIPEVNSETVLDKNPIGLYFLKLNFQNLVSFKDAIKNIDLKPISMYVQEGGDAEIFLAKESNSITTPEIKFNIGSDFQNITENLEAALDTEPLKSKFKNSYSSLEYIDLRYGNRVYDKFQ